MPSPLTDPNANLKKLVLGFPVEPGFEQKQATKNNPLASAAAQQQAPAAPLSLPAEQIMPAPENLTDEEKASHAAWAQAIKTLAVCEEVYFTFLKFRMSPTMAAALKKMQIALGLPDPPPLEEKSSLVLPGGLGVKKNVKRIQKFFKDRL